jgi:hypothetical protein
MRSRVKPSLETLDASLVSHPNPHVTTFGARDAIAMFVPHLRRLVRYLRKDMLHNGTVNKINFVLPLFSSRERSNVRKGVVV